MKYYSVYAYNKAVGLREWICTVKGGTGKTDAVKRALSLKRDINYKDVMLVEMEDISSFLDTL